MRLPYGITITVRRGSKDTYGDPLPAAEHQIAGCAVAPSLGTGQPASRELADLRETVETGYTLYLPYGADLESADEVLLPGDPVPWRVDGNPGHWKSPLTGWTPGAKVTLRRSRG